MKKNNKNWINEMYCVLSGTYSYLQKDKWFYFPCLFFWAIQDFLYGWIIAWLLMQVTDIIIAKNFTAFLPVVLRSIILISFVLLLGYICGRINNRINIKIIHRIKTKVLSHLLYLPAFWYDKRHSGDIMSRLTTDVDAVSELLTAVHYPVSTIIQSIGASIIIISMEWRLFIVLLLFGIIIGCLNLRFISSANKYSNLLRESGGSLSERITDLIASIFISKLFNLEEKVYKQIKNESEKKYQFNIRLGRVYGCLSATTNLSIRFAESVVLALGGLFIIYGNFKAAALVGVMQLTAMLV